MLWLQGEEQVTCGLYHTGYVSLVNPLGGVVVVVLELSLLLF